MSQAEPPLQRARTKIVATVGPACLDPASLAKLVGAGVDVFRLNMAHGDLKTHEATVKHLRKLSQDVRPIAILVDLAGPKIRLGQLFEEPTHCERDGQFRFVRGTRSTAPDELTSNYSELIDELSEGDRVMLADGTVSMVVESISESEAVCRVTGQGILRSRQGINLPGVKTNLPALTKLDRERAVWAAQQQVDYVSLSFVRAAAEVHELRNLLDENGSDAPVIAKIEKPEALEALEDIVTAADGIMVARGDLGVEIDVAEMPVAQKRIIATCNDLQRPVIVATQMLDSMQRSRLPTRAESTDVANAILDGADACMLSGETAIGKFPLESVQMMNRIMCKTEELLRGRPPRVPLLGPKIRTHPITVSVVYGAATIALQLDAKLVVIVTHSGATAVAKAAQRDFIPTVGISHDEVTLRRMALLWGTTPLPGIPTDNHQALCQAIDTWGQREGTLIEGDRVVVVMGTQIDAAAHNLLLVHEVGGE